MHAKKKRVLDKNIERFLRDVDGGRFVELG